MKNSSEMSAKAQIRNLLIVIGAGVICAVSAAGLMLGNYGPSGNYNLQNVLLSPETAQVMNHEGLMFDHVEYSAWNPDIKKWTQKAINLPTYQNFYSEIHGDVSLQNVLPSVEELFNQNPTTLTVFVRGKTSSNQSQQQTFQTFQFGTGGDVYRVELRTSEIGSHNSRWAYFQHSGVENRFLHLLAQENEGVK